MGERDARRGAEGTRKVGDKRRKKRASAAERRASARPGWRERVMGSSASDAAAEGNGARPVVAFVHIPKTAGGTVSNMLVTAYSKDAIKKVGNYMRDSEKAERKVSKRPGEWEAWSRSGGRVSIGHTPYSVFRDHMPEDSLYITFLREPVSRVRSHYFRHVHRQQERRAGRVKDRPGARRKAGSIEEALVEMRLPQLRNLQTRFLCDRRKLSEELPPSALEEAKENMRKFALVGIQERFDESLVLLERMLGLDSVPYLRRHVSSGGGNPELTDDERALIEEHNRLDMELYAFGVELFEEAAGAVDADELAKDVDSLRSACAAATEEYHAEHRELTDWLDRELPAGATRPLPEIREAAEEAGISAGDLKRGKEIVGAKKVRDDQGRRVWTRSET